MDDSIPEMTLAEREDAIRRIHAWFHASYENQNTRGFEGGEPVDDFDFSPADYIIREEFSEDYPVDLVDDAISRLGDSGMGLFFRRSLIAAPERSLDDGDND